MKKSELKQLIREELQKALNEGGPDKYVGNWKGKKGLSMYEDDEGNIYIKSRNTNYIPVAVTDGPGNQRSEKDIYNDIRATFNRESYQDYRGSMGAYY